VQQAIRISVNGKERDIALDKELPALLTDLGIDPRVVAVALNGDVISRDRYDGVVLHEGDRIEVVRMVGGG
jgi:sulfur carrier protein